MCGAALAAAVCMNSMAPMKDNEERPVNAWTAIKWNEVKSKPHREKVKAPPDVLAALGDSIRTNGTHVVFVGTNRVQVVSFSGHAKMVVESPGTDRGGLLNKVIIPMISSPVIGFIAGLLAMSVLYIVLRKWKPVTVNRVFGKLQLCSSAYMGFSHGMNDATKCMGIITLALVAGTQAGVFDNVSSLFSFLKTPEGSNPFHLTLGDRVMSWLPGFLQFGYTPEPVDPKSQGIPSWVVIVCALTMAAGTAAGGWRIIRTLGHRVVKLQPVHGFAAETMAATVLAGTAHFGMPVSTTHAITTSIMGVGCAKRFSALKLRIIERIVWAWILTLPITALIAFLLVWLSYASGWLKFAAN
jgi:PiT family inorganic phosphate transporter